ncbi:alpha-1,4-glucan--maltose-1-phosphate maltosyltransferase [Gangjinia marincola]|uniref:Alpha-1,4-glucan:maltose-1-phosphate maltosyltransferase n=1 Tax=Gangjinia marincola TaxID=578463 RepID=A0ABP3XS16_9FLAO
MQTLNQERVVIEHISPQLNHGTYFIKRVVGESVTVTADILVDGHDVIQASVRFKHEKERTWKEVRMHPLENDAWQAEFSLDKQGYYTYNVEGWVDYALNWLHGTRRKLEDNQHVRSELLEGSEYLKAVAKLAKGDDASYLTKTAKIFKNEAQYDEAVQQVFSAQLHDVLYKYPEKEFLATSHDLQVYVDRTKARFSTWYEFFPRSAAKEEGVHGTFKDCEAQLPRIAAMGFDVLYFPPIHPIGELNRKGKNNATHTQDGDVGSPWAIGAKQGGHKAIHPQLGTEADFKQLVTKAKEHGIEIAMDFALQAAPDHPWVKEHPEYFKWRPDGTVQYAENPPKKYQDIQPIYFETKEYKKLWKDLIDIALYWIEEFDIQIFRVDNPHTKPHHFWGWLIHKVKKKHPDVLFLAEAFTKPKVMNQLAKQGFTQSYTYFTWRTSKHELEGYLNELTKTDQKEYFRPNFWPNTPDINPWILQGANEAQHLIRYALAATLSSNIGLYGPVYEQMRSAAVPGKEEYLDSEKYQVRHWDWSIENKLTMLISSLNNVRKEQPALQQTNNIEFCYVENDQLLAFYKYDDRKEDELLIVVSLDAYYSQSGQVKVPLNSLQLEHHDQFTVSDLITGSSYQWTGEWNFVELHPTLPFHIFKIKR